jgi:ATP-dependent Clp protease ATP-binding subunit ClpC
MAPPWAMGDEDFDPTEYLINYNEKFENAAPTMYRDSVIQQTLSCLIGKFKPNALLIGAAGVGKTKIVEDIARRIANKDALIPSQLLDHTVWELPLTNIVAGSGIVGEVERKTKNIIEFAANPANKVILFIDEIHMLVGESQTYSKIAQLMKPALARGDMKVIGATTLQESQNLMDDPAFNRRFTRLIVDELSQMQTKEILNRMSPMMFQHYENRVALNPSIISEIVTVADEYKTIGSHRPDNAITLLDRAMADALIQRKTIEEKAKRDNDTTILAALNASPTILLSKSQMKKTAMKLMTGNNKKEDVDINRLKTHLSVIKGQDEAVEYLLNILQRDSLNLYPRTKPLTVLFAGNSGVGKSEVAKIIAREITNVDPIIINMTEYNSDASINRIIGSPAGYVGSDSKSELPFDILESNPYQVILLDEFEKGSKAVQRLFMSAFDEGYIKTAKGKIVDFSKTIIIATTNAGHTTKRGEGIGFGNSAKSTNASISELSDFFDVELLNRFTKILNFNPITEDLFRDILADTYARDVERIKLSHTSYSFLPDTIPDDALETLVKDNYNKFFGARPVKKAIQKYIEDAVIDYKTKPAAITDSDDTENIAVTTA